MDVSTKVVLWSLPILLMAAQSSAANPRGEGGTRPETVVTLGPCALPTAEITSKLPWFIKASDVICMSVTADDLQASEHARMLLLDVGARLKNENSFSRVKAEFDRGMTAYGEGNYTEAISHLQAATPSNN